MNLLFDQGVLYRRQQVFRLCELEVWRGCAASTTYSAPDLVAPAA